LNPVSLQLATAAQNEAKFCWLIIAPFGGPVVPDVYENVKQSLGKTLY
jgi:hypothetical protein